MPIRRVKSPKVQHLHKIRYRKISDIQTEEKSSEAPIAGSNEKYKQSSIQQVVYKPWTAVQSAVD